jgi:hypothetical protein
MYCMGMFLLKTVITGEPMSLGRRKHRCSNCRWLKRDLSRSLLFDTDGSRTDPYLFWCGYNNEWHAMTDIRSCWEKKPKKLPTNGHHLKRYKKYRWRMGVK